MNRRISGWIPRTDDLKPAAAAGPPTVPAAIRGCTSLPWYEAEQEAYQLDLPKDSESPSLPKLDGPLPCLQCLEICCAT